MKTFKILGLLLDYPKPEIFSYAHEMCEVMREEGLLKNKTLKSLQIIFEKWEAQDVLELQEHYVELFDRGRAHCLHLFEHVYGESRDRGQAMNDLAEMYQQKDLNICTGELPDYLPLFLEYLSLCEPKEAATLLGDAVDVIAAIGMRIKQKNSVYYQVFAALEELSAVKPDFIKIQHAIKTESPDPQTFQEVDRDWQETPAFDNSTNCNNCGVNTVQAKETVLHNMTGVSR